MFDDIEKIYGEANAILNKLGLPEDLFYDITNDIKYNRDALFIIKSHALMEALIKYLLTNNIRLKSHSKDHEKKLAGFLSSLSMKGNNGSIKLAFNIGVITKEIHDFADAISEVRNSYAHRINDMRLKIEEYLSNKRGIIYKLDILGALQKYKSLPDRAIRLCIMLIILHCLSYVHNADRMNKKTLLGDN